MLMNLMLGPVLEEPCGYFYGLGLAAGRKRAAREERAGIRGQVLARMEGRREAGAPRPTAREELQEVWTEMEALEDLLAVLEVECADQDRRLGYQVEMVRAALWGAPGDREAARMYVARVEAVGRLMVDG